MPVGFLLHCSGVLGETVHTEGSVFKTPTTGMNGGAPVASTSAKISLTTQKFGRGSLYFDGTDSSGSGNHVSATASPGFDLSTGNFTIDCWVDPRTVTTNKFILSNMPSVANRWYMRMNSSDKIEFTVYNSSVLQVNLVSTSSIATSGVFTHVAATYDGTTVRLFINGVMEASSAMGASGMPDTSALPLEIGRQSVSPEYNFNGYIDEVRILYDECAWTGNFTPASVEYDDPQPITYQLNTDHTVGANGCPEIVGGRVHTMGGTSAGPTIINTDWFDGAPTLHFNQANEDCMYITDTVGIGRDFDMKKTDFVIEGQIKRTAAPTVGTKHYLLHLVGNGGNDEILIYLDSTNLKVDITAGGTTTTINAAGGIGTFSNSMTDYQYFHFVRDGVNIYFGADQYDSVQTPACLSSNPNLHFDRIVIGSRWFAAPLTFGYDGWFHGDIADLRVIKGARNYSGAITTAGDTTIYDVVKRFPDPVNPLVFFSHCETNYTQPILQDAMDRNYADLITASSSEDTVNKKFGRAALKMLHATGSSSRTEITGQKMDFHVEACDFTVETWFRPTIDIDACVGRTLLSKGSGLWSLGYEQAGPETMLLMHFDGADAQTTFPDSSYYFNVFTDVGTVTAELDTTQKKFGATSLWMKGSGARIGSASPMPAPLVLGTHWFIDFWVYRNVASTIKMFQATATDGGTVEFNITINSSNRLYIEIINEYIHGSWTNTFTSGIATGSWTHIGVGLAPDKKVRMFVDGVMNTPETIENSNLKAIPDIFNTASSQVILARNLDGWVDEFRIQRGVCPTASFTPEVTPYTNPTAKVNEVRPTARIGLSNTTLDAGSASGVTAPIINTWHHLAFQRRRALHGYEIFIDGVKEDTIEDTTDLPADSTPSFTIGSQEGNTTYDRPTTRPVGQFDDLKFTWGKAKYNGNFTPEVYGEKIWGPLDEPKLLLHLNNNITDNSNYSKATSGSVTFDAAGKFSDAAIFDGATNYIAAFYSEDINLSDKNFVMDAWVKPTNWTTAKTIAACGTTANDRWEIFISTGGKLRVYAILGGVVTIDYTSTNSFTASAWNHVAVNRYGLNIMSAINGVVETTAITADYPNLTDPVTFGYRQYSAAPQYMLGQMDEIRVVTGTEGTYEFNTTFTPPTAPYALDGGFDKISGSANLTGPSMVDQNLSGVGTYWATLAGTLPAPTISSLQYTPITGTVLTNLPKPTLSSTANVYISGVWTNLPSITLSVSGRASANAMLANIPTPLPTMSGYMSVFGSLFSTLPALARASISGGQRYVRVILPTLTNSASGLVGRVGTVQKELILRGGIALVSAGVVDLVGTVNLTLPSLRDEQIGGIRNVFGYVSQNLPAMRSNILGEVGRVGTLSDTLPAITINSSGKMNSFGNHADILPVMVLFVQGGVSVAASEYVSTMNVSNGAVTEYTNYLFNSACSIGDDAIVAGVNGLYVVGADDDDGADIDADFNTGITNIRSGTFKRVPEAYLRYRAKGNMYLKTITDEQMTREYLVPHDSSGSPSGQYTRRVKLGKGVKSGTWQFGARNESGNYFKIHTITYYVDFLKRMARDG